MSQRYFLTAESTYEDLRQSLNAALAYPNSLGKSVFQTALYAPRDNFRRVLLAVDTAIPGYATVNAAIQPLLDSDAMEEIDEATYLSAVASATAGASAWADITDKPTFAAVATSGSASDLSTGTLNASRLPASVVRTGVPASGNVQVNGNLTVVNSGGEDPSLSVIILSDGVDDKIGLAPDGSIFCTAIALGGSDLATTLAGKAASSHTHGSITNAGAIGTTSGLIVTTGASGVLGTLAMGTAGQVLKVNSGATGVEWGTAAADVSIDTTAADILSASSGSITADDPGADRLVFWDDSAGKLTHLEVGTGLALSGTTLSASGGGSTNVWIPASAFIPRTTNGCGVDSRETSTNRTNWDELLFDAGADEFAQAAIVLPSNYNAGTFTARFYWTASGATDGSDDVIWGIQSRAFANDDALDTAFGTAQTVTDTVIATNDMHVSSATSAVTVGGTPAANVPLLIQIYRDADAAGDTYGHDARLLGVEISYTAA